MLDQLLRDEIKQLLAAGPLPSTREVMAAPRQFEARFKNFERLTKDVTKPVTDEEACALVTLFGPDECFGQAWTLVHLIETAPNWPLLECLNNDSNEWIRRLKDRALRAAEPGAGRLEVTRGNLVEAVDLTLSRVRSELENAGSDSALGNDLEMALKALEAVHQELHGGPQRPKGQRSGMFTRYVIDEGPRMAMDPGLRATIERIEHVYKKY